MLLLDECLILACQKVGLGFLNVRSVKRLATFSITESISTFCLSLTVILNPDRMLIFSVLA